MDRAEILRRFEAWLDTALTGEDPPAGIPAGVLEDADAQFAGATDWHTIWSAMTALTQEVKLQGRSFKQLSESLDASGEKRGRKETLGALLEVRERLNRGMESVRGFRKLQPGFLDSVFAARWREIEHAMGVIDALAEGYRLSAGHLDDVLNGFGVRPVECLGKPFDPRRMNAVDVEETTSVAEGTVLSVYRDGYEWNGELFRPAQVRVARRPQSGGSNE